jgi:hypothetical protein
MWPLHAFTFEKLRGAINHSPGNDMESYSHPIITPMEKLFFKEYYSSNVLSMSIFVCHYGYVPIGVIGLVTVFDHGVHHKLLMFLTRMGSFACHWHRHQVQGTSV